MLIKKIILWAVVNGTTHLAMDKQERTIAGYMPLVDTLFPGINYYSVSGFGQVFTAILRPACCKLFPELIGVSPDSVNQDETAEVSVFLASKGYAWQDSRRWKTEFKKLCK